MAVRETAMAILEAAEGGSAGRGWRWAEVLDEGVVLEVGGGAGHGGGGRRY